MPKFEVDISKGELDSTSNLQALIKSRIVSAAIALKLMNEGEDLPPGVTKNVTNSAGDLLIQVTFPGTAKKEPTPRN